MARNLVDVEDGFLRGKRFLIMDRDPLYPAAFRRMMKAAGVKVVRLPARSPNLNAYAERFVLSIKSECLDRIVPLGEGHLRRGISEYVAHYHHERNHQGLENALIDGRTEDLAECDAILRRSFVVTGWAVCAVIIIERRRDRSRRSFGIRRCRDCRVHGGRLPRRGRHARKGDMRRWQDLRSYSGRRRCRHLHCQLC
jgi:hypothetical protein